MAKIAVYPGTFDPITNGHLDIIKRGLTVFDHLIVAILHNPKKNTLFTVEERLGLIKSCLRKTANVSVDTFSGLLVDYAVEKNINVVLRGMRATSDFEYEFQLALMNRRLNKDIQTVFLMTGLRWIFTSSSIIKEAARFNGNIRGMVPRVVEKALSKKLNPPNAPGSHAD